MISILSQEYRQGGSRGGLLALAGIVMLSWLMSGFAKAEGRPGGVPAEAVPFKGHWYALYYEEIHSWPEAIQACQGKGGHLACLESAEEREFVTGYADSVTTRRFWVGGFQEANQWRWITGLPSPSPETTAKLPPGSAARLCVSSKEQGRILTSVLERPVSELKSYVCEWAPNEKVAFTLPATSTLPASNPSVPGSPAPSRPSEHGSTGEQEPKDRIWTSTAGTRIQARLIDCDGKVVRVQTSKQQIELMVNKLIPDDQIFLKSWMQSKPTPPPHDEPAPLKPWPATVEVTRTPEIAVVSEDEKAKKYVYQSPHYEFTAPIRLSKATVQELAVLFEATYALLDALPVGLNLRVGETTRLKVLLVEDIDEIIKLGGSGSNEFTYLDDTVVVTLGNLGAEKKNGRWNFTAHKTTLWDVRTRIAEQLYSPIGAELPVWFDMGFGDYVAEMRYNDGRFLVSSQRGAVRDFVKRENPAPTCPMPDLKSCMEMSLDQWTALLEADKLGNHTTAMILLVYYFLHLDGQGDSAFAANYVKAMAAGMPAKQAQEQFLLRGRSYADLAAELEAKFRDAGIRIEVQEPKE